MIRFCIFVNEAHASCIVIVQVCDGVFWETDITLKTGLTRHSVGLLAAADAGLAEGRETLVLCKYKFSKTFLQ